MPTRILMVCLGNICRSPLAEGILRDKVDPDVVIVDSAGTAGYHIGNPPDPRSISVARKYGLDISQQRSRKFTSVDLEAFDIIYAMDHSNYAHILDMARDETEMGKVKMLLQDGGSKTVEVPDPYYGPEGGFERVFHLIDKACTAIAAKYTEKPWDE
ncbi:MAG: low molecular weight protein-tyrosine-phosphatase [Bacteroidota bacterium]